MKECCVTGRSPGQHGWRTYLTGVIARELSRMARYFDDCLQYCPLAQDNGRLLEAIEAPTKRAVLHPDELPDLRGDVNRRTLIVLNGNVNHEFDIQGVLAHLRSKMARTGRVALVCYNSYLGWLYLLANRLGLRAGPVPTTFLTEAALASIAAVSGFAVVRSRRAGCVPFRLWGVGDLLNRIMPAIPGLRLFSLVSVITLRPIVREVGLPSVSVIIPARNERGNIEGALQRLPSFGGARREVIFVEGHSTDETWTEIERVAALYRDQFPVLALQQTGHGKADAVRLGFSKATGDLLMILDADLTMPPELLERFYQAYCDGHGDFINGNRLVYPMEGAAMKFLNHLGNIFFAKALSRVLGERLGDSLCGTKVLARHDYQRMIAWRRDFGDFDPFGDFELLFPAATLGLGIVDMAIRYRDRVYGTTNIRRFYHGWMLLRMTIIGFFRVKLADGGGRRSCGSSGKE